MRKTTLSLIALLCLTSKILIAQTKVYDLPVITPPSPNAVSLGKFGDVPVSSYTGIPDVSVPIYTVALGNFSMPLSLSYHSQGLKIEEMSNWVGLNWALNAGGVITRTVHTLPDEDGLGYWNHADWTDSSIVNNSTTVDLFCKGQYDVDPDMFYFNFNGKSGKFVMDGSSQHAAHVIPYQHLLITHNSTLSSFQITDENGVQYIFDVDDVTTDDNAETIRQYTSSWYLSKIITPAGTITFTYGSDLSFSVQAGESDSEPSTSLGSSCAPLYGMKSWAYYYQIQSHVLQEINTSKEKIKFYASATRTDFGNSSMLDSIAVFDYNTKLRKRYLFSHSYFGNTTSTDTKTRRLKLDSIREVSLSNDAYKRYAFEYNNPTQVPSLLSKSQDYWGFYNGATNSTLLPYIDPSIYGTFLAGRMSTYGNRDPSLTACSVGTLSKITYPTGGYSSLTYELNDYGSVAGTNILSYATTSHTSQAQASRSSTTNLPSQTVPFSITTRQNVAVYRIGSYSTVPLEDGPSYSLKKVNADGTKTAILQGTMLNTTFNEYYFLEVGNYELFASVDATNQSCTIRATYFSTDSANAIKTKLAGGVRVKQIIDYDPVSGKQKTKSYSYTTKDDMTRSSGCLAADVILISSFGYVNDNAGVPCAQSVRSSYSCGYLGATQGSHIGYFMVIETDGTSGQNGKKETYYTSVNDYPNQNIRDKHYSVPKLGIYSQIYALPRNITDYDFNRGLVKREIIYNSAGIKLKSTNNSYNLQATVDPASSNYFEYTSITGYQFPGEPYTSTEGVASFISIYRLVNTVNISPWIYKTGTVDSTFDMNGQNPVVLTTNYFYDNPSHAQITRTETTDSKGIPIKLVNKYAADKALISGLTTAASATLDTMVVKNMVLPVVQEEYYKNNILISTRRTDYRIWDANSLIISPEKVWSKIGSNALENRLEYTNYDVAANLVQARKSNNVYSTYIYDYHNAYPIASVSNADNSQIAYTSFEADGTGNWTKVGTVLTTGGVTGDNAFNGTLTKSLVSGNYIVTCWGNTSSAAPTVNSTAGTIITTIGNWRLYRWQLIGITSVSVQGANIDEVRLYPVGAQMTTYAYTPLVGVSGQCSAVDQLVYYEYDGLGRLKLVRDQNKNIVKKIAYNYAGQP